MSMKTFSHQSEQRLKTSSRSQAPFFKKLRCLLVGSQHGVFHLVQVSFFNWRITQRWPLGTHCHLTEVGNPTQCGWHHPLAAVLDCTAV